jgi:metal iron transporter
MREVLRSLLPILKVLIIVLTRWQYMRVRIDDTAEPVGVVDGLLTRDTERAVMASGGDIEGTVSLANNWLTAGLGWLIWFVIAAMNIATLTFLGLGIGGDD